jgi:hypothetical protein
MPAGSFTSVGHRTLEINLVDSHGKFIEQRANQASKSAMRRLPNL